jgi:hypothetical protein
MEQTVLNRLIAARHLIEASGPDPTASAPSLLVAQKILIAHDASELVFLALSSSPAVAPRGQDGQIIKDPSFMKLAQTVLDYAAKHCNLNEGSQLKVFDDLNEARKLFKHSGILVDPISNAHLFANTIAALDELCICTVGQALLGVDQTSAIASEKIRTSFASARKAIAMSEFKFSLEQTARGLATAFWEMTVPVSLTAGKPSSEEALLLSGRGIDPASFLSMQQLLPVLYIHHDEPDWNLRKYGHEANWTYGVAESCLETAIDTVIKLQSAPTRPIAIEFYEEFEDVIEIITDTPEAYWAKRGLFTFGLDETKIDVFQLGDRVFGQATGHYERSARPNSETEIGLEHADWIAIERPRTERMEFTGESWHLHTLWLKKDQIQISYQRDEEKARIRELFRQDYEALSSENTSESSDMDQKA